MKKPADSKESAGGEIYSKYAILRSPLEFI